MHSLEETRKVLKGYIEKELEAQPHVQSDQQKGLPKPEIQKPVPEGARIIDLIGPKEIKIGQKPLFDIICQRKSRRRFTNEAISLEELSFLLFSTQGVLRVMYDPRHEARATLRTSPSGGARHPFETYLFINRVTGLDPGLYRYLPLDHKLCFLYHDPKLPKKINDGCGGQTFVGTGAVVFIWTAIPYRMEWRYRPVFSSKIVAQDSGHLCQNLYLASEAIGCGTCAIGAYLQEKMDAIVQVDGQDEFTIYVAPVGRIKQKVAAKIKPTLLNDYIGSYYAEPKPETVIQIKVSDNTLQLFPPNEMALDLIPQRKDTFIVDMVDDEITFVRNDQGIVTGFKLDQSDNVISFIRK